MGKVAKGRVYLGMVRVSLMIGILGIAMVFLQYLLVLVREGRLLLLAGCESLVTRETVCIFVTYLWHCGCELYYVAS